MDKSALSRSSLLAARAKMAEALHLLDQCGEHLAAAQLASALHALDTLLAASTKTSGDGAP